MLILSPRLNALSCPREEPRARRPEPDFHHVKVLVVEDTPIHLLLINKALHKRGVAEVLTATSGAEALDLLRRCREDRNLRPGLILLDLQLPGVSGFHVLANIKSTPSLRTIPVVVLSCPDSQTDVERCMAAGAEAFVSKIEDYDRFRALIFEILDLSSFLRCVH